MDMTKWAMFFSFDVMGEVGFSTDFQSLEKGEEHEATKPLHESMGLAYNVGATMPWLLSIIVRIPGASGAMEQFVKLCSHQLDEKKKVMTRHFHCEPGLGGEHANVCSFCRCMTMMYIHKTSYLGSSKPSMKKIPRPLLQRKHSMRTLAT